MFFCSKEEEEDEEEEKEEVEEGEEIIIIATYIAPRVSEIMCNYSIFLLLVKLDRLSFASIFALITYDKVDACLQL